MNKEYQARSHGGNSGTVPFPENYVVHRMHEKLTSHGLTPQNVICPPTLKLATGLDILLQPGVLPK